MCGPTTYDSDCGYERSVGTKRLDTISTIMQAFIGMQEPICQPVVFNPYFPVVCFSSLVLNGFKMSTKELVDSKLLTCYS